MLEGIPEECTEITSLELKEVGGKYTPASAGFKNGIAAGEGQGSLA
jgi:hypothetical protein